MMDLRLIVKMLLDLEVAMERTQMLEDQRFFHGKHVF